MRGKACRKVLRRVFYQAVGVNAAIVCIIVLLVWVIWMKAANYEYDTETKDRLIDKSSDIYKNIYEDRFGNDLNYDTHCKDPGSLCEENFQFPFIENVN
jgi:hypothetical protein